MLMEEPLLLFRCNKVLLQYPSILLTLIFIYKECILNNRNKIVVTTTWKNKINKEMIQYSYHTSQVKESIDMHMYVTIQDSMLLLLCFEIINELSMSSTTTICSIQSHLMEFIEWILYNNKINLKILFNFTLSEHIRKFIISSHVLYSYMGHAIESMLLSTDIVMNSTTMIEVLYMISTMMRYVSQRPLSHTIAALVPSYLLRMYSSFSLYDDIDTIDVIVCELLDLLTASYPWSISKLLLAFSKSAENVLMKPICTKIAQLQVLHHEKYTAISVRNGIATTKIAVVPPPL
jgi:hypothetical protein